MNKTLLIGVGVLAVVGVGGFLWYRSRQKSTEEAGGTDTRSATPSAGAEATTPSTPEVAEPELPMEEPIATATPTKKEARQEKRQNRRDCRKEAKAKGLKGKAKRNFKRECKAAGGINADFSSEEADFAFNGFDSFN
jgi:hypothetical protein